MRKALLAGLALFLLLLPANAQESDPVSKYLELAHKAMEAQIKAGDALLAMGDVQGALRAYEKAVAIFRDAARRENKWRAPAGPEVVPQRADEPFTDPTPLGGRKRRRAKGGSGMTENAVELGLKWLADHQDVNGQGMWDCDEFSKHDPADDKCDGPGKALYDPGVTGLSILAFLGAGYTDRGTKRDNPYAKNVRMALRYLSTIQDDDGCFGPRNNQHFVYNHSIAALAMCEAWAMTRNPRYKKPAQDGLNFISTARNPYLAWRYGVRPGDNDTSVTGWMVMALKSGKFGGLDIDPDAFEGAPGAAADRLQAGRQGRPGRRAGR